MKPKMSLKEAEQILDLKPHSITHRLKSNGLPYYRSGNKNFFTHSSARHLFQDHVNSLGPEKAVIIAVQIVKGGVGKTALTINLGARLNLLGYRVCIVDLDQQGNATRYANIDDDFLDEAPILLDVLEKNVEIEDTLVNVADGLSIIPSRIDNALLDDTILIKAIPLNWALKKHLDKLRSKFDFILIDCPPSLGKSVGAAALSSDFIVCPVEPDRQCLSGIRLLNNGLNDLAELSGALEPVPFRILLNQFELNTIATSDMVGYLDNNEEYRKKLFKTTIHKSQEFKNKCNKRQSIYDTLGQTIAKNDIDFWTQEVLDYSKQISSPVKVTTKKTKQSTPEPALA